MPAWPSSRCQATACRARCPRCFLNPRLSTYLIPGIVDIPEAIESVVLELGDALGPWGARGMAEMPLIPYGPAVVAALHDATGVWLHELPLTPDRVVAALRAHGISGWTGGAGTPPTTEAPAGGL